MNHIFAHLYQNPTGTWEEQTLEDHSLGVAELMSQFAARFGSENWGKPIGRYHDLGKALPSWQHYLLYTTGYALDISGQKGQHSLAGALLLVEMLKSYGAPPIVYHTFAYSIIGHHSGLPNWSQPGSRLLAEVLKQTVPQGMKMDSLSSDFRQELMKPLPDRLPDILGTPDGRLASERFAFWGRMLFSCLVDADWLDTERFMNPKSYAARGQHAALDELNARLDAYLGHKQSSAPKSEVNLRRQQLLHDCQKAALLEPGVFSLTAPTGSGKTLSGMSFALQHALQWSKDRIIIALPYTSIIEQNALVYKYGTADPHEINKGTELFGEMNVIEHHSSFFMKDDDNEDNSERLLRYNLATENWDAPIIVTTNVQLFESLFAANRSQCRKLHNITNSVIILDEAQMLPSKYLMPILHVLKELVEHYGVTLVLSTATQPALTGENIGSAIRNFDGFFNVREIVNDPLELARALQRVEVSFELNASQRPDSWVELAARLGEHKQVLCIVNTRKDCRNLRAEMPHGTWHLSALMCAEERSDCLAKIKRALQAGEPVRVISTQLIEAGVDIDFPIVFRAESGLDSIAQSAGRCNREGLLARGKVVVFQTPPEASRLSGDFRSSSDATRALIDLPGFDFSDPSTFTRYFKRYYADREDFGKEDYDLCFENGKDRGAFEYRFYAERFNFIEPQRTIIVRYEGKERVVDSSQLIEKLKNEWTGGIDYQILRELQRFSVTVRERDYQHLVDEGLIEDVNGIGIQREPNLYVPGLGVDAECLRSASIV
jgi:CRISPR-associated endonuclease/helicase Cas3